MAEKESDALERAIAEIDKRVLDRLDREGARRSFDRLVNRFRVPRDVLIGSLHVLSLVNSKTLSYSELTGFSSRDFGAVPKNLYATATIIRKLASARRFDLLEQCFPPLLEDSTHRSQMRILAGFLDTAATRLWKQVPALVGAREDEAAIA